MKTKLLIVAILLIVCNVNSQTTHNLDWFAGIGSNVDLTIESGDTVIWTWTSPNHTVENDPNGTSVETFDSGFLGPNGSTFSHTFTTIGSNDYFCSVHGAGSMSGTITVTDNLSLEDFDKENSIKLFPNPSTSELNIQLLSNILRNHLCHLLGSGRSRQAPSL